MQVEAVGGNLNLLLVVVDKRCNGEVAMAHFYGKVMVITQKCKTIST